MDDRNDPLHLGRDLAGAWPIVGACSPGTPIAPEPSGSPRDHPERDAAGRQRGRRRPVGLAFAWLAVAIEVGAALGAAGAGGLADQSGATAAFVLAGAAGTLAVLTASACAPALALRRSPAARLGHPATARPATGAHRRVSGRA